MFAAGERVELTESLSAYGLRRGEVGTVISVYNDHRTYVVAFAREGRDREAYDVPYLLLRRLTS